MFRIFASISVAFLVLLCYSDALPIQELPPKKGHVPVYIRVGDTPLTEVHPGLAEAFHEGAIESGKSEDKKEESLENQETKVAAPDSEQGSAPNAEEVVAEPVETVQSEPSDEKVAAEEKSDETRK